MNIVTVKKGCARMKFKPGEIVIVSDFPEDPETVGVRAEFVGITADGKHLAKSLLKGKYTRAEPIEWAHCFHLSEIYN
jgi:hypothetical protein